MVHLYIHSVHIYSCTVHTMHIYNIYIYAHIDIILCKHIIYRPIGLARALVCLYYIRAHRIEHLHIHEHRYTSGYAADRS